jgi:lipopolysaccharide export system permease protein
MDLFSRYIFKQLASSFLLILVTLTTIIWLSSALAKLSLLTTKGQSVLMLLNITGLALPALIGIIAPNALLVACLYTLDRLNGDSELIVMSASGARVWRFAAPCIALASILCVCILIINLVVAPASLRQLRAFITQVQTDLVSQVLQPGRFSAAESGLTFHIRDRNLNGELEGLIVHDSRAKDLTMTYLANRGQIVSNDDGSYLVMKDGQIHRQETAKKDQEVQIVAFEQYIFDISQYGPKSKTNSLRRGELYLSELMNPDPNNPDYKRNPGRYNAEIHERFSSALYPLTYIMIVIAFLGQPRTVRENRLASIVMAFGVAVALRAAGLAATNLLTFQPSATTLVYGIPIGAIIVAGITAHVRMAPYALPRINLDALAKLQILNNKILVVLGVKTEQNGGRVG